MFRLISSIMLVACTSSYAFAAERATFILTDGERKSGTVVFHGDQHENLINGYLNLGVDGGKDMTFPVGQVAMIDFVGAQPSNAEMAQLGNGHMLVLRNGAVQQGRLINMTNGDTLFWENAGRQRQQYAIRDVSRVYLNPESARTIFGYVAPPAPPPTTQDPTRGGRNPRNRGDQGNQGSPGGQGYPRNRSGQNQGSYDNQGDSRDRGSLARGITVRVDARQDWTDSGITVTRGDRLVFETSDPNQQLLGLIGSGTPFRIFTDRQEVVMRASGRLMLGARDDERRGNLGSFSVYVSRP